MKKILLAALLLACAAAASAQVDETDFFGAMRRSKKPKDEPRAVAEAVAMAFSSGTWTAIDISTSGPVVDLSRLVRDGFYKREIITLVVIGARAKKPLKDLAAKRKKGASLSELSFACGLDYDKIYETVLRVEAIVDKQYLPRFPQRPPRRGSEDPY